MKKSKAIKLVLVSGLITSGSAAFSVAAHRDSPFVAESNTKISFAGNDTTRAGYHNRQDTAKNHSGPGIVTRGGWGFFGHFGHSSS